jgi:hypothetical protein
LVKPKPLQKFRIVFIHFKKSSGMKRFIWISCLLTIVLLSRAQLRISVHSGTSTSLISNKQDSVFFGRSAIHVQTNIAYYSGRLGWGITTGLLKQKGKNPLTGSAPPAFLDSSIQQKLVSEGGGLTATYILAGPELCMCNQKIKITPTVKFGLVKLSAPDVKISRQEGALTPILLYGNKLSSTSSFAWMTGIGIHYLVTPQIGIGIQTSYMHFSLKADNRDFRRGNSVGNNAITLKQQKSFLNIGGGVLYRFN